MKKTKGMMKIDGVFGKAQRLIDDLKAGIELNQQKVKVNEAVISQKQIEIEAVNGYSERAGKLASKLEDFISVD